MKPPTLVGTLGPFGTIHLLRLIRGARVTGRLDLQRDGETMNVWIESGETLFLRASSNTLRVGDILVRRGDLIPEAVDFALAVQSDNPGARIGRMLVDSGALTEDQLREALLAVQRHVLARLLQWRTGTFAFVPDERIAGEDVRLDLDKDVETTHLALHTLGASAADNATSAGEVQAA
jgi:hypothetical protein